MRNVTIISRVTNRKEPTSNVAPVKIESVPADVYQEIYKHNDDTSAHPYIQEKIGKDIRDALVPYATKEDLNSQLLALELEENGVISVLVGSENKVFQRGFIGEDGGVYLDFIY